MAKAFSMSLVYECRAQTFVTRQLSAVDARKEQCVIFLQRSTARRLRFSPARKSVVYNVRIMCLSFIDNINIRTSETQIASRRRYIEVIESPSWLRAVT